MVQPYRLVIQNINKVNLNLFNIATKFSNFF